MEKTRQKHSDNTETPEKYIFKTKICEFFNRFELLQMQSKKTEEYIFGLYISNRLVGHIYFGYVYSEEEIIKIKRKIFPPTLADLPQYELEKTSVKYYLHPMTDYEWISPDDGYKKSE